MSKSKVIDTAVTLSDEEQLQLIRFGDMREAAWLRAAKWYERKQKSTGVPVMALYQEMGRWIGVKASAIRSWVGIRTALTDELIEAFPQFRLAHWRIIRAAAGRQARSKRFTKEERFGLLAGLADKFAENAITPETLAERLNGKGHIDLPDPFLRALRRGAQAMESARKNADSPARTESARMIGAQIEAMIANVEAGP